MQLDSSNILPGDVGKQHRRDLVYLAIGDELLAIDLTSKLKQAMYKVRHFNGVADLIAECENNIPLTIIIDPGFGDTDIRGVDIIARIKQEVNDNLSIIFISDTDDIDSRLASARAGACRYFHKPIKIKNLMQALDSIGSELIVSPYRVILIDDDENTLESYAAILRKVGMEVEILSSPLEFMEVLMRFRPDIIVVNYHISCCSGQELVKMIRQNEDWAMTPIIYLSNESDINNHMKALEFGADDFLIKPVTEDKLIATVSSISKRTRWNNRLTAHLESVLRENKFQLVTMDQHDIVSITDVTGRIIKVNDRFCEISGYSREELLGQNHRILKSDVHSADFYTELWRTISSGKVWHGIICNCKKNGDEYWVDSTIVPFLDEKGKPYKYVSARTDITALRKNEERLYRSQVYANIGTWDWNIRTGELFWSERIGPLFGFGQEVPETTYENFINSVHPDDRQAVIDAVNACIENNAEYNIEHRVLWPDGSVHWVQESGDVLRSEEGEPLHMLGVVQNIDTRKHAELALSERERQLVEAQTLARIGHWQANMLTGELSWSDEIYRIFGYDPGSFEPSVEAFHLAVHPDDLASVHKSEAMATESGRHDVVHRIVRPDGTIRHVHELAQAETDDGGNLVRLTGTVQDVTERVEMEQRLERQKRLLDVLHRSTTNFVIKGDIRESMKGTLDALLDLTGSEYGFTGEVFFENGAPYLRTHAITNISWSPETQKLYHENEQNGFEFRNLDTLFGRVLTTRKSVVSNNPSSDVRAGGLPEGHPPLNSFLGVPIIYGKELVGMYGLANREEGYDDDIQEFLRPFDISYGAMIHSRRMTERDEQNREALIEAKEEAENASLAKSQFLSSMSHELRTPMNAIMGFSQLLKIDSDNVLSKSQDESVDEILNAGQHLLELINEILDLSRIETGRLQLSIETVVISEVVSDALQLITPLAQKRGIEISVQRNGVELSFEELSKQTNAVRADWTRLKQILLNLLSNAVKYNRENGKIIIACDHENDNRTRISITDTGIGLTPSQQSKLFIPFNRLGIERSDVEGAGIGLVITKNILEFMDGNLGFVSEPGKGSTFWFELPTDKVHAGKGENLPVEKNATSHQVTNCNGHTKKVLYIEDNPANLRLVTQLLGRQSNIHILSAHDPLLGLQLAAEHQPDLILLDINLPGMDGYKVIKRLKNQEASRETPIIAISANAMPADIEKGLRAGFDDYITKPINVNKLLEAVETFLYTVG